MERNEFQKKAVVALLGKIAEACGKAGVNPSITVSTRKNVACFQLRRQDSCIQVSVKHSGEINYSFSDKREGSSGKKIYYEFCFKDSHEPVIEKFAADFGRLYKDFLLSGTLHDFCDIRLSYGEDAGAGLEEYESCIGSGGL